MQPASVRVAQLLAQGDLNFVRDGSRGYGLHQPELTRKERSAQHRGTSRVWLTEPEVLGEGGELGVIIDRERRKK